MTYGEKTRGGRGDQIIGGLFSRRSSGPYGRVRGKKGGKADIKTTEAGFGNLKDTAW